MVLRPYLYRSPICLRHHRFWRGWRSCWNHGDDDDSRVKDGDWDPEAELLRPDGHRLDDRSEDGRSDRQPDGWIEHGRGCKEGWGTVGCRGDGTCCGWSLGLCVIGASFWTSHLFLLFSLLSCWSLSGLSRGLDLGRSFYLVPGARARAHAPVPSAVYTVTTFALVRLIYVSL
jgi:hypothetical protein